MRCLVAAVARVLVVFGATRIATAALILGLSGAAVADLDISNAGRYGGALESVGAGRVRLAQSTRPADHGAEQEREKNVLEAMDQREDFGVRASLRAGAHGAIAPGAGSSADAPAGDEAASC